ncbi:MAG: tetratricopeptide repeat protein [Planctomycetes bacterium]|nr:tetratricopeptide repeat protein [Planctomycetota bacterium]
MSAETGAGRRIAGDAGLAALAALPLLAAPGLGPDALRLPAAAALVTLLALRVAWSAARRGETGIRGDPLRTAMTAWFVCGFLSLASAADVWAAIGPLLLLFLGIAAYLCITSGVLSRTFLAGTGSAVLAAVGLAFATCAVGQQALGRPATATIGNTNTAGAMAAMLCAFALGRAHGSWRWLHATSAAALLLATVLTGARGALAGLVAGALVSGGAIAWRRWGRGGLAVAGLAALLGAAAIVPFALRRTETARVRIGLWKGAFRLFLANPIVGCGIGNFSAQFPPYRDAEEFRISNPTPGRGYVEAENPHSTWVQTLAETGVPGLLSLLLVAYVAARLWRYYVRTTEDPDALATIAGAGGAAASFLVSGFFYSLHVQAAHSMAFFVFLGTIELLGNQRVKVHRAAGTQFRLAVYGTVVILGVFACLVSFNRAVAERHFLAAPREPDADRMAARLRESLDVNFRDWRPHMELARVYAEQGKHVDACTHFRQVLDHRPFHAPALGGLAESMAGAKKPPAEVEAIVDRAIRATPYYYQSYYQKGVLRAEAADWAGARAMFSQSARHHPAHAKSYFNRGLAAFRAGDFDAALADFRRAVELEPALRSEIGEDVRKEPRFAELFGR